MEIDGKVLELIKKELGSGNVKISEPMKEHLTMKVGGPAAYFFTPHTKDEIKFLVKTLKEEKIPYYILGAGSNVLVKDGGFDGAIICLKENFAGIEVLGECPSCGKTLVRAEAGVLNKDFSNFLLEKSLSGFEFASGIPGSVGGGCCMNAGAYDGEFKNVIKEVVILDKDGEIKTLDVSEMDYGYRKSIAIDGGIVILEAVFTFLKDDKEKIQERIAELTKKREEKQPLEYPSCGSTFKRPEGNFAGKLISDANLKGKMIGGAQVSEKHAGFIINKNNATAEDILELIEYVKGVVKEKSGVSLECEVRILG